MKILIVFALIFAGGILFSSCNKNENTIDPNSVEFWQEEASKSNVTIEFATLDEINEVFKEFGLPIVSKKELEKAELRCTSNCTLMTFLADFNYSSSVTAYDAALIGQYVQVNGTGSPKAVDVSSGSWPLEVHRAAFLTNEDCQYLNNPWLLTDDDKISVIRLIQGYVPCE